MPNLPVKICGGVSISGSSYSGMFRVDVLHMTHIDMLDVQNSLKNRDARFNYFK